MWFKYKGFDSKGDLKQGSIEGENEEDIILHLRTKGVFGVSLVRQVEDSNDFNIVNVDRAGINDVKTSQRSDILKIRFDYDNLRNMLRSLLLDVGITEDILRGLIIDLKSDNIEKQKKVMFLLV